MLAFRIENFIFRVIQLSIWKINLKIHACISLLQHFQKKTDLYVNCVYRRGFTKRKHFKKFTLKSAIFLVKEGLSSARRPEKNYITESHVPLSFSSSRYSVEVLQQIEIQRGVLKNWKANKIRENFDRSLYFKIIKRFRTNIRLTWRQGWANELSDLKIIISRSFVKLKQSYRGLRWDHFEKKTIKISDREKDRNFVILIIFLIFSTISCNSVILLLLNHDFRSSKNHIRDHDHLDRKSDDL